jgi:predicted SAM-dependent methyltransferase
MLRKRSPLLRVPAAVVRRIRVGARRAFLRARGGVARLDPGLRRRDIRRAAPERFVRYAYPIMLRRQADGAGVRNYVEHLERGVLTPDGVLDEMLTSMELREIPYRNSLRSLHQSRCDFVRLLPRARRILDLGGTDQDDASGSLVSMGYPYEFDELVIVDLPHDDRHEIYAHSERADEVATPLGPVRYAYHSMSDLSGYEPESFDMVFSGESIEHIPESEAEVMLRDVHRVLRSGGWLALDTPNRAATIVQTGPEVFTNPDHDTEYTHTQMTEKFRQAGFVIRTAVGLSYVGESIATGAFSDAEFARQHGVYHDIENCYLLAYLCQKP